MENNRFLFLSSASFLVFVFLAFGCVSRSSNSLDWDISKNKGLDSSYGYIISPKGDIFKYVIDGQEYIPKFHDTWRITSGLTGGIYYRYAYVGNKYHITFKDVGPLNISFEDDMKQGLEKVRLILRNADFITESLHNP